jgi:hypothetical protein
MGEAAFLIAGLGLGMPQQARKGSQQPHKVWQTTVSICTIFAQFPEHWSNKA